MPLLIGIPLLFVVSAFLLEATHSLLIPLALLASLCALVIGVPIFFGLRPRHYRSAIIASLGLALVSVVLSSVLPFMFTVSNDKAFSFAVEYFGAISFAAWVYGLSALLVSCRLWRYSPVIAASLVGMALIVVLLFMLWLHIGIPQYLAAPSSIALCAITALRLASYINGRTPPQQEDQGQSPRDRASRAQ